jgi:DNA-binding protein HU-beta
MNKADLVAKIAKDAKISKAAASVAVDSFLTNIERSLKKGQNVTLVGFGTFSVTKRKARTGRNPQTGQSIKIKARKVPKFKPGKQLRDTVNKK